MVKNLEMSGTSMDGIIGYLLTPYFKFYNDEMVRGYGEDKFEVVLTYNLKGLVLIVMASVDNPRPSQMGSNFEESIHVT